MSADELRHVGINLGATDAIAHRDAQRAVFGFWVFLMPRSSLGWP